MGRDLGIVGQHVRLSLSLFLRYGAMLTALWAMGDLLGQILLRIAVELGLFSRLLGLLAIAPVILLQLLLTVSIFLILRGGLPRLHLRRRRRSRAAPAPDQTPDQTPDQAAPDTLAQEGVFSLTLLAVLIPFYGYYAGWGFLSDTLTSYLKIFQARQMAEADFTTGEPLQTALDVSQTGWVVLGVLLIWVVRRIAKAMQDRSHSGIWPLMVVACEATWALLGLYVIGSWKSEFTDWLATLPRPEDLLGWIFPAAEAAIREASQRPVDWAPEFQIWPMLQRLFWYALLPLIWFNLGAIVYGHDLTGTANQTRRIAGRAITGWNALPRPVTDFIGHFWMGVLKRWNAVMNGVLLAASAGFALTASVLVLWRLVDWLGNWAWRGLAYLIGPHAPEFWQVLSVPLNALFNAPGVPGGGLLTAPLQFCILAAGLEMALRAAEAAPITPADTEPA